MLFYLQMRWNTEGRATLDEVFRLQEGESTSVGNLDGLVAMYKVAAQRRVSQLSTSRRPTTWIGSL